MGATSCGRGRSHPMEQFVAAVLRGDPGGWPPDAGGADPERFLEAAARHGVAPLLVYELDRTKMLDQWPAAVREPLVRAARRQVWVETRHRSELQQVLRAIGAIGVPALLMKGAALAYLSYPDPCFRPRYDTDLMVRKDDMPSVARAMRSLGYSRSNLTSGDLVMPQCQFVRDDDRRGPVHAYDFHWKMAIPVLFADVLSFDEVAARAIEVPALGARARALGRVDALLLACIHRVAHHHGDERLLWLYDIHLLANEMDGEAFQRFSELAAQKQIRAVCAQGLTLAHQWLHTRLPAEVMSTLAAQGSPEPTAVYLGGRLRQVDVLWSDLRALGAWSARWRLLREHLFPPAAYMMDRSGVSSRLFLPGLYASRIVRGAWRWFDR